MIGDFSAFIPVKTFFFIFVQNFEIFDVPLFGYCGLMPIFSPPFRSIFIDVLLNLMYESRCITWIYIYKIYIIEKK